MKESDLNIRRNKEHRYGKYADKSKNIYGVYDAILTL